MVTNFEVAFIKKLWQCSVLIAVPYVLPYPPLPPTFPPWGSGKGRVQLHISYLRIPAIFQLVCRAFLLITMRLAAVQDQWRCVIATQIKRNWNPNRPNRKNWKLHWISNLKAHLYFLRKPNTKINAKTWKQTAKNTKTKKPKAFWHKTEKPI